MTPIIRVDIVNQNQGEGDIDRITELIAVTVHFQNTRAKDVAAVALAREFSGTRDDVRASLAGLSPGNSDALGKRFGDVNVPGQAGAGIYSPDEDPIFAYVPMAQLLNDPVHPLDPYATEFYVTFNLGQQTGVNAVYATELPPLRGGFPIIPGPGDTYNLEDYGGASVTPINLFLSAIDDGGDFVFYVLAEPSRSLRHKGQIEVDLDQSGILPFLFPLGRGFVGGDAHLFYVFGVDPLPDGTLPVVPDMILRTPFADCMVEEQLIEVVFSPLDPQEEFEELCTNQNGELTTDDLFLPDGQFYDDWAFNFIPPEGDDDDDDDVMAPEELFFILSASGFNAKIQVQDPADDDPGDGIDLITADFYSDQPEVVRIDAPGEETIINIRVTSRAPGQTGSYSVQVCDVGFADSPCLLTDAYFTLECPPQCFPIHDFPQRPRVVGVDLIGDQVPLRKIQNFDTGVTDAAEVSVPNNALPRHTQPRDSRAWSEFPSTAQPAFNEIWSQWPPGYPMLSLADRDPANASDYIVLPGRIHPDSGIVHGPIPSPEVFSTAIPNSIMALDFGSGWPGGYSPRIDTLRVEVQGLGGLRELPIDGADNDGDGLTDEPGVEDDPEDLQLPGRNDDFDFYFDLLPYEARGGQERGDGTRVGFFPPPAPAGTPASTTQAVNLFGQGRTFEARTVNGLPMTEMEKRLVVRINQLYAEGRRPGQPIPGLGGFFQAGQQAIDIRTNSGIMEGVFNKGWDPIFDVIHVLDERNRADIKNLPPKHYRDLVTPGYDPSVGGDGLTNAYQPELRILLDQIPQPRRDYVISLLRIGAIQSRHLDEDGDGEAGSPEQFGFKLADFTDNDTNRLVDEGIDEEAENHLDDDLDGLVDEDINYVPLFLTIDEEIHNFFIDGFEGTIGAFDRNTDFYYIDYNNNGIYEDGRVDHISPSRDEFVSGPDGAANPLTHGASYYTAGVVYPVDDDLDAEGEDGNPLTPPVATYDGIDNDGDGLTDEGWNEDVRDVVFGELGNGRLPFGYINGGFLFTDSDNNSFFDGLNVPLSTTIGTSQGGTLNSVIPEDVPVSPFRPAIDTVFPPMTITLLEDDPDHYLVNFDFGDPDLFDDTFQGVPGPEVQNHFDGKYDHFLGLLQHPNMPLGIDYQVTLNGQAMKFAFDYRTFDTPNPGAPGDFGGPNGDAIFFSRRNFIYPHIRNFFEPPTFRERINTFFDVTNDILGEKYTAMAQMGAATASLTEPVRSNAYQISKRIFTGLEMADMMGFISPLEKDGGFRGRPYLEASCKPTAILGINVVDTPVSQLSAANTRIESIRVNFQNVDLVGDGVFDPTEDFLPLTNLVSDDPDTDNQISESGVALYRDNKNVTPGTIWGEFDPTDIPVPMIVDALEWRDVPNAPDSYFVTLRPANGPLTIPGTDFTEIPTGGSGTNFNLFDVNRGYDYFVVVRTSDAIDARDTFQAFIRPGDIRFTNGFNVAGSFCMTHPYTTNVPTALSNDVGDVADLEPGGPQIDTVPGSDSLPVIGIDLHDSNNTFSGTPARLSAVSVIIEDIEGAIGDDDDDDDDTGGSFLCSLQAPNVFVDNQPAGAPANVIDFISIGVDAAGENVTCLGVAFNVLDCTGVEDSLEAEVIDVGEPIAGGGFGPVDIEVGGTGDSLAIFTISGMLASETTLSGSWTLTCDGNPLADGEFVAELGAVPPAKSLAKGDRTAPGWNKQGDSVLSTFLNPLTDAILSNIPLDPDEDNDNDPRTFPIPDGLDNDGDGLTDEGVDDTMVFDPGRYTSLSGVALFRDMPDSDTNGGFDDPLDPNVVVPDLPVFLSGEENYHFPLGSAAYVTLALDHDPVAQVTSTSPGKGDPIDPDPFETIPTDNLFRNNGPDYFVVVRTSRFFQTSRPFRVRLGVLMGNVNPEFPNDDFAVFGTPLNFMPGSTTGIGPVFPFRQPYAFDPLRNFRGVPSTSPIAEEPLSPGGISIPNGPAPVVLVETPFTLNESYKSISSSAIVAVEDGNSPPQLRFLSPSTFPEVQSTESGLVSLTAEVHWNDLDQDSTGATVTLVYFPVYIDDMLGEVIPKTPLDLRPDGMPFGFQVMTGYMRRLNTNEDISGLTPEPYENIPLSLDNELVNPVTLLGNDVFTWDTRGVNFGTYRIAAFLDDMDNPRILVVGGIVEVSNDRPVVVLTRPVGDDDGTGE